VLASRQVKERAGGRSGVQHEHGSRTPWSTTADRDDRDAGRGRLPARGQIGDYSAAAEAIPRTVLD